MINRLLENYKRITTSIHYLGFESYMVYFNRIKDWESYGHDHPEWFKNWDKYLFEKTLSEIASIFDNNDWKYVPGTITDMSAAMCALFDIFTCLKQDNASYLCYYFSSLVANDFSLPLQKRIKGNQYRAYIFLKDNSWGTRCELFCELHNVFDINYEGHFTKDFYDLSLLYDVYKAWHSIGGALLNNLKKQAPLIKLQYSNYSKDQIMIEGELAHNALFEYIRGEVEWDDKNNQSPKNL